MAFDDVVRQCYTNPTLFTELCSAVDKAVQPLQDLQTLLPAESAADVQTIYNEIIAIKCVETRRLYTWMFKNTSPKTPPPVYNLAPLPITWP